MWKSSPSLFALMETQIFVLASTAHARSPPSAIRTSEKSRSNSEHRLWNTRYMSAATEILLQMTHQM